MEDRVIELEKKAAFLEHTLAELNDVVAAQHAQIDALQEDIRQLNDKLASGPLVKPLEEEEPPPHY